MVDGRALSLITIGSEGNPMSGTLGLSNDIRAWIDKTLTFSPIEQTVTPDFLPCIVRLS